MYRSWLWRLLYIVGIPTCLILAACGTNASPTSTKTTATTAILGQVTAHGITLSLHAVTATALATEMSISLSDAQGNSYTPDFSDETLYLVAHGNAYSAQGTMSSLGTMLHLEFPPFVDDDFGHAITATLVIVDISQGLAANINGPWKLPFTVTPALPRTLMPTQPPEVHNGMGLQVTRVDWVNSTAQHGVRVRVRISNPASVIVNPSEFSASILNASLGNFAILNLPDRQQIKPDAFQYGVATTDPASGGDFITPARFQGEVNFVYMLAAATTTGQTTLHIDAVPTQNATTYQSGKIVGPWNLVVPA